VRGAGGSASATARKSSAQEDSDCYLGTGWQKRFEDKVDEILKRL
jgi:hypothetical protein